ncbi:MAG: tetratricopeptide repeat protein [Bacteroidales bacterium]|nr:tetratricopeptide repeat protein [Bacteroidales bacterium]
MPVILLVFFVEKEVMSQQHSLQETEKLISIADSLSKINPDSSLIILNNIISLTEDEDSEEYMKVLWVKGLSFYYLNNNDSSIFIFRQLEELSNKNKSFQYKADALKMIALVYRNIGNYKKSIESFKACIELCKKAGLKDKQAAAMNNLGIVYEETGNFDESLEIQMQSLNLHQQLNDTLGLMACFNNIGLLYRNLNDYDLAYEYYLKVLAFANKTNSIAHKSRAYANIGVIYTYKEEYDKALEYFFKALKLKKIISGKYGLALTYENIGEVYFLTKDYLKAEKYYNLAYELFSEGGNYKNKVTINIYLAKVLIKNKKFNSAFYYIKQADSLLNNQLEKLLFPEFYEVKSQYYEATGNYGTALKNYKIFTQLKDSLHNTEINDKIAKQKAKFDFESQEKELKRLNAETELNKIKAEKQEQKLKKNKFYIIGTIFFVIIGIISFLIVQIQLRKNRKATALLQKNRQILLKKNYEITLQNEEIKNQTEQLYAINDDLMQLKTAIDETDNAVVILDKNGNFEWGNKGFDRLYDVNFEEFRAKYPGILDASKKSSNYDTMSKVIKKCIKYKTSGSYEFSTFNKKGEKIWIQTNIKAVTDLSGNIMNLIVIDTDVSEKVKTGRILEQKNYELEKQKEEIDSSLRYAQTIQKAILPAPLTMRKNHDFFLVYLPKDIVSGDFYWFSDQKNSPYTFFAVVDCTGHGVPGAFMSMIGARLLNFIVNEKNISDPADILEQMHVSVKIALKQNLSGNKDGMDISLCRIEKKSNSSVNIVFSGAKQSVYYYKTKQKKLIKIRGDVKTIGGHYYDDAEFSNKSFRLEQNDMLYLLTDGYIDQDSPEGKKIGSAGVAGLLNKIGLLPLKQQKEIMIKLLNSHKKDVYQRDDITFLGIKIE